MLSRYRRYSKLNNNRNNRITMSKSIILPHKFNKPAILNLASIFIIIVQVSIGLQIVRLTNASAIIHQDEANFEPVKQITGHGHGHQQVIASASQNLATPAHRNGNPENYPTSEAIPAMAATNSLERRLDRDPEEEFDDDERDEDKSGSSQHGSFENPSFGESQRSARDGEEIENFFDKHLGPPMDGGGMGGKDSSDSDADMSRPVVSERVDPDDGYETAASSPLSDIFHTLIKAHRRPFVITTTSGQDAAGNDGPTSASSSSSSESSNQQQSAATAPQMGAAVGPQTSASNPMTSPSQVGPFIGAPSPFPMDPSSASPPPFPGMAQVAAAAAMSPMAYFAPMASPSTMNPYEPPVMPAADSSAGQEDHANGGREIYIVRRPSVLQHIRAVAPPLHRLVQQSSNAHWRGLPLGAPLYHHLQQAPRPYHPEESPAAASDYAHNYPIGAHSYSYPREQAQGSPPQRETSSAAAGEDEPTNVSYSLSFGGQPSTGDSASTADEQDGNNGGPEEQSSADEASGPYQPRYGPPAAMHNPARFTGSSSRAYNNYNYPPPMVQGGSSAYLRTHQGSPSPYYPPQGHYHGARYHKDPSESPAAQPINYAQYSPLQSGSNQGEYASWIARQQLLANLDRQIKNNQYYKQNLAQQQSAQDSQRAPIMVQRRFKTPLSKDDNDVDSFSSFHSEIDPYKSFTASSKLVSEPQANNALQKGGHRVEPNGRGASNKEVTQGGEGGQRNDDEASSDDIHVSKNSRPEPVDQAENDGPSYSGKQATRNLLTGPVSRISDSQRKRKREQEGRSKDSSSRSHRVQVNHRVRREDVDDRENDEVDDDGVWVDDDEDDDNRQTASDLNETTHDPEEEEAQQESSTRVAPVPGVIGNPHGYELSR